MSSFNIKPLIDKFQEYITENAQPEEAMGAAAEFQKLLKSVFSTFNSSKAEKNALASRKSELDSFIRICDTLGAAEDVETCIIPALAYSGRAAVCQALGDLDGAAKDFRRSADAAAGNAGALDVRLAGVVNLASVCMRQNKPADSVKNYSEAERLITRSNLEGDDRNGRLMSIKADRGCVYCRMGMLERANEDFASAIELYAICQESQEKLKPVLVKCYANRSGVLVNLKQFEQARLDGLKAKELEGNSVTASTPVALTNLAAACKCLGYFEEADGTYTRVIMLKTASGKLKGDAAQIDIATLLMGRGEAREKLHRQLDAEADFSAAIETFRRLLPKYEKMLKPRLINALKLRGRLFQSMDEEELGQSDLDEVDKLTANPLD